MVKFEYWKIKPVGLENLLFFNNQIGSTKKNRMITLNLLGYGFIWKIKND